MIKNRNAVLSLALFAGLFATVQAHAIFGLTWRPLLNGNLDNNTNIEVASDDLSGNQFLRLYIKKGKNAGTYTFDVARTETSSDKSSSRQHFVTRPGWLAQNHVQFSLTVESKDLDGEGELFYAEARTNGGVDWKQQGKIFKVVFPLSIESAPASPEVPSNPFK